MKKEVKKTIRKYSSVKSPFNRKLRLGEIPDISDAEGDAIEAYVRSVGGEVYGSIAARSYNPYASRNPSDIDVAVPNPKEAAYQIKKILSRHRNVRDEYDPKYKTYKIKIGDAEIVDIQDLRKHQNQRFEHSGGRSVRPEKTPNGTYRQHPGDQLLRKSNSVGQGFSGREHRREKDSTDFARSMRLAVDSKELQKNAAAKPGVLSLREKDVDYDRFLLGKAVESTGSKEAMRVYLMDDPIPQEIERDIVLKKKRSGGNVGRVRK